MKLQHERDRDTWSAPQYVKLGSITVVEHDRLPIDEAVVKDIMSTITAGDMNALPPIYLWRKQPGGDPILIAGRNCLEAHKRCDCEVICARVITGETPEIVRTVQRVEFDENLNKRELSPALRQLLIKQRKALYEGEHPETKRGSAGGRAKAGKGTKSQNATERTPAFIDSHAKQTGRHRATIAREISEAAKIGDDVLKKIVATTLDRPSEITALAAMDERERQEIVDRAVAGEKVSAAKTQRKANIRCRTKRSASDYNHGDPDAEDHQTGTVPEVIQDTAQPQADDRAVAAAEGWLPRYEAVKARQAGLVKELEGLYRLFEAQLDDLLLRIKDVDGEARRVNDAKPSTSHGDGRVLSDTESVARTAGLSITKYLGPPAWRGNSIPPLPLSVQIAANVAAIPGPLTSPEQIAARNATLLREETKRINAYVASLR
jgi:ParB family transcriptional regulator, chromosome partitioning protein